MIENIEQKKTDNVDIFICAHKDFRSFPNNPIYKVIHGDEKINVPLEQYTETHTDLSDMQFSLAEGSRMYWIWKNYKPKKYIGFCHYRKYFDFFRKVPDMDSIFSKYDIIATRPMNYGNIIAQYTACHRLIDFMDILFIIKKLYPDWYEDAINIISKNQFYTCNMFIMKSEDFDKYCSIIFPILKEFCKSRNWNTDEDIKHFVIEHKEEYIKRMYPNNTIEYQSRILGYLLERLTSLYISTHFKNPYLCNIMLTEDKYRVRSKTYVN